MKNLKSSFFLFALTTLLFACQSKEVFRMENFEDLHVINTKSNRVRQKCLFLDAEEENKWRHQYMMYLLDNKNQVIEVMQSLHMDKESCYSQVDEIENILKKDPMIRICVRDELKKTETFAKQNDLISFDSLGSYHVAYEPLTLDSICNSKKCIGDNSAWVKTCPGFNKH